VKASFVAEAIRARSFGASGVEFRRVGTDSRAADGADLFVALHGERFDGNDFIEQAMDHGAKGVVCDVGRAQPRAGVAFFEVPDTLRALGDLAAAHRRGFDVPIVAITGSNGKTTTKNLLRAILSRAYGGAVSVLATEGNLNNLIGMPLTLLRLDSRHRAAVLEMGMNAFGEIARMTEIAAPTHGLITCVAAAHLQGLGSIEGVAKAKGELFAGLGSDATALVNLADPRVVGEAARSKARRFEFGPGGVVRAENVEPLRFEGMRFRLSTPAGSGDVRLQLLGPHNVANALAAAAAACALGVGVDAIVAGLESAAGAPMRLSVERLPNGIDLINDAYNANPSSMRAALASLAGLAPRAIVVLGEMRELGGAAAELHAEVGAAAASIRPALLCAVGNHAADTIGGAIAAGLAPDRACAVATNSEAAVLVAGAWRLGDAVLVKGSRGARMEEVVADLERRANT
jgi:UDP-N-acetylmuramoyl-tripeptide--D-alanyl-D-alanine ligase